MTTVTKAERGFTIVRRLDAPRELVFQAWTDPDHLVWFAGAAPGEHPTTVDLRVGGAWRFHMVESDERNYVTGGIYREIEPPSKLVFTWGAVGGWPAIDPSGPDDNPVVTVTLNDVGGATEMVFQVAFADHLSEEQIRNWFGLGVVDGWTATLERLDGAALKARSAHAAGA